jgi:hypothetical protein
MQMARFAADALRGRRNDPSWDAQGNPLPPQAVLDQPMPVQGQGIEDASGLVGRVGGVAAALAERERLRRLQMEQMSQ